MTDQAISALPAAVLPLTGAEFVPLVQSSITCKTPLSTLWIGTTQLITSGGSATVAAGVIAVILDGAATTFALTLPAPTFDGQELTVSAATAISVSFSSVVTAPATVIKTTPATIAAGVGIAWKYRASNTTWYRLY